VNAAFLLVTTAWFAGDTGMPAPSAGACCGTPVEACGCASKPKLFEKLCGSFKHKSSCDTCSTCAAPAPKCAPPAPVCAPAPCDTCGKSGHGLLNRLKSGHHQSTCCDSCATSTCSSCGSAPAYGGAEPKGAESIPSAPKKMPNPAPPAAKQVQINNQPSIAPGSPALEIVPNVGQTPPAIVPSVETENLRNPF